LKTDVFVNAFPRRFAYKRGKTNAFQQKNRGFMTELLDIYDDVLRPLAPFQATYDEVHRQGLWHQTFAGWLVNPDKRTVILQLRGPKNRIDPGSFDASGGGHLVAGEKAEDGFRELKEELGVDVPAAARAYLGIYRNIALRGAYINREFCHIFLAKNNLAAADMTPEAGEVNGIFEVAIEEAIDLFSKKTGAIKATGIAWNGQGYEAAEKTIAESDMCNFRERCQIGRYYLKVMLAAKGLAEGASPLVI
jgi:8-oxo-dGTP pyrophosphatase MutT (NUDIX family)